MSKTISLKKLEQYADGWTTVESQKSDQTVAARKSSRWTNQNQTEDLT
jgi:hypothetical protein